ncbi:hypothetical protein Moror_15806 [Moniliophthora roreri MCA 2997]|uniref:Uncharacterized protein n=1 Tax=Moniliophthora roreri (strain MCA 2997) TaxID=1381753 RepID=V2XPQ3_MONRO|nr:hypothetical protein Moror_15806 [Moniliophthora roreri MCA 2997]
MFEQQHACAEEPWNQEKFETLLVEWIVTCDQPFDEVEKLEFIAMITCSLLRRITHPRTLWHLQQGHEVG